MKIVLTVNAAWNVWNFRRDLVRALLRDGHEVTILAPHDSTVPQLEGLGAQFRALPMSAQGLGLLDGVRFLVRFFRECRAVNPDVLLGFTIKNNLAAGIYSRFRSVLFVPNVTGLGTAFLSGGLLRTLAQALCRLAFGPAHRIFFQNPDDEALFVQARIVRKEVTEVVPGSGVDLEHFAPKALPPDGPVTFLMVSRLVADKGVREFVEAAQRIQQDHPEARFQLLGDPRPSNRSAIPFGELERWIEEGILEHLDPVADVRPVVEGAHCVVLPSYREGLPRGLLEAAAMARPVITTDVPGCREVVVPGESGYLCRVRDGESLAECMRAFLELSPAQRAAMGQSGRDLVVGRFGVDRVIDAYRRALLRDSGGSSAGS